MTKQISIALATYKGAKYLPELLQSLSEQSFPPYELVVSDDNSPDETLEIVEAFAESAPFNVRIIRNKDQLGIIKNFAKAFDNTAGELIAYCDQDDIWAPDKLEKCVEHFSDPRVKLVMHRSQVVNGKLEPLGYHIPEKHESEFGEVPFPSSADMSYGLGHQMLFDAQIYRDYSWIFHQKFSCLTAIAENYDTQFRFLAGLNGTIVSLEDALVKFRRHDSATSDAGLVDGDTATTAGFLNKSPTLYAEEAETLSSIADVFEKSVVTKMCNHKEQLSMYILFLKQRATLYLLRANIYGNKPLWVRVSSYLKLVSNFAYRKKAHRGFGHKAIIVDGVISILGLTSTKKIIAMKR